LAGRTPPRRSREHGRLIELRKRFAGLLQESSPSICDSHAGAMSFEQRDAELVFEYTYVPAHRRLPDA
jgi:hypothetical protein